MGLKANETPREDLLQRDVYMQFLELRDLRAEITKLKCENAKLKRVNKKLVENNDRLFLQHMHE